MEIFAMMLGYALFGWWIDLLAAIMDG